MGLVQPHSVSTGSCRAPGGLGVQALPQALSILLPWHRTEVRLEKRHQLLAADLGGGLVRVWQG